MYTQSTSPSSSTITRRHAVTSVLGEHHARPTAHLMYGIYLPALKMWTDTFLKPNKTLVIMSDAYFKVCVYQ